MKSLKDFFIAEKLRINKDLKFRNCEVEIPKYSYDDNKLYDETWKTFVVPDRKWVIFNDKYRLGMVHFGLLGDMLMLITMSQDDYEDFNPDKDILYASDDVMDAFNWYINYLGIDEEDLKKPVDDIIDDGIEKKKSCCDSDQFFAKVYHKEWKEKELMQGLEYLSDVDEVLSDFPAFAKSIITGK